MVKVFKLFCPKIEDVFIIRHAGTLKGIIEGRTDNSPIDMFQGNMMVNIGDGKNIHTTIIAKKTVYTTSSRYS